MNEEPKATNSESQEQNGEPKKNVKGTAKKRGKRRKINVEQEEENTRKPSKNNGHDASDFDDDFNIVMPSTEAHKKSSEAAPDVRKIKNLLVSEQTQVKERLQTSVQSADITKNESIKNEYGTVTRSVPEKVGNGKKKTLKVWKAVPEEVSWDEAEIVAAKEEMSVTKAEDRAEKKPETATRNRGKKKKKKKAAEKVVKQVTTKDLLPITDKQTPADGEQENVVKS